MYNRCVRTKTIKMNIIKKQQIRNKKHSIVRKTNQSIDNNLIKMLKSIIKVCFLFRTRSSWWTTAPHCLAQRHRAHYEGWSSVCVEFQTASLRLRLWSLAQCQSGQINQGLLRYFCAGRSLHTFWKVFNLVQEANQRRCEWFRTDPLRSAVWQVVIAPRRAVRAAGVEPTMSNSTAEGPHLRHTQQLDREVAGQISPLVRLGGAPTASKMDLRANLSCVNINPVDVESLMSRVRSCLNSRLSNLHMMIQCWWNPLFDFWDETQTLKQLQVFM